ncbi:MAG: AI-2E family transporter [Spirochaetales bacterium]|nr:AI-2E family transporter [Spirochaetales bacterium]
MNDKPDKSLKTIKAILVALLIIVLLVLSKAAVNVSIRILLSFFVFLLVLPFVTALEKAKFPSWLATVLAVLVIVIVVVAFIWFVFFSVDMLMEKVPGYASRINEVDIILKDMARKWVDIPDDVSIFSSLNIDWVGGVIMPALRLVSSSAIGILSNVLLVILMTTFLLGERHVIIPKLMYFITGNDEDKVSVIWDRIIKQVSKYISIKVFVSIITGALFYAVARVSGLDFAPLWGVMAIVLNFIPTIGSIIITALMILMSFVQFAPAIGPIIFVSISAIVIQNVVGNFLDPKLSGNSLNLSAFIILVGLGIFGFIWGIVGMFLAVPILSVLQIVCANIDETRPIAMLLSSGKSFRSQASEKPARRRVSKRAASKKYESYDDDIMFPDKK